MGLTKFDPHGFLQWSWNYYRMAGKIKTSYAGIRYTVLIQ